MERVTIKVALIQFNAGTDKAENLRRAQAMVVEALGNGAKFVLLPEVFHFRGRSSDRKLVLEAAEYIPGPSALPFMELAAAHKAHILIGSIYERSKTLARAYNTSILIDNHGHIVERYRKINLFDARIDDKIVRESDCFAAGRRGIVRKVGEFTVGLSICYDLRFPLLYRRYAASGADCLTVPSCFTKKTGQAHWEVLLRARAIENLAYVLAPNQVGIGSAGVEAYGNSMIVSPWGEVLARGSAGKEEIIYGRMDRADIIKARSILPGIIKK